MRADIARLVDQFGPDKDHRRLTIGDDEADLGSGQPPVHRRHHDIGFGRAEQEFKIDVAVLAQIGDALARLDAERAETVGDLVGPGIEGGKAGLPALELERDGVAAVPGPRPHHVGKVLRCLDLGHVSLPGRFSVLFEGILASSRGKDNIGKIDVRGELPPSRAVLLVLRLDQVPGLGPVGILPVAQRIKVAAHRQRLAAIHGDGLAVDPVAAAGNQEHREILQLFHLPTRPIGLTAMVRAPASSPGLMRLLMPSVGISPGAMVLRRMP